MARRTYTRRRSSSSSTRRSYSRAASPRKSYGSGRKRPSSRSGGGRTIRIVLETNNASGVQRPDMPVSLSQKTAAMPNVKPRF